MYEGTANGNFNSNTKASAGEIKQTESERILFALDHKIEMLDKTASSIVTKVTSLGGFELVKGSADPSKAIQGGNFIGELDLRLDKLQSLVEAYSAIFYNLERLA
jgi:hypothetical protein